MIRVGTRRWTLFGQPAAPPKPGGRQRDVWGVGLVKAPLNAFLQGWPEGAATIWLDAASACGSHADPFAFRLNGRMILLAEHVPRPGARGEIVALEVDDSARILRKTLPMRLPVHLSYPFLIEQQGVLYCIPESAQANAVLLFRAEGSEPRWVFDRKLIDGFAAVDSTVIFYQGRFWLFCTRYAAGPDNPSSSELHIFHAADLRGPWRPHAGNPVKRDRSNARPAGTPLVEGGQLFRFAQDCSETYGGSVKVNRVEVLTETDFVETVIAVVRPAAESPFPDGLHHLSSAGEYTLIDGKRSVPDTSERPFALPVPGSPAELEAALAELSC